MKNEKNREVLQYMPILPYFKIYQYYPLWISNSTHPEETISLPNFKYKTISRLI